MRKINFLFSRSKPQGDTALLSFKRLSVLSLGVSWRSTIIYCADSSISISSVYKTAVCVCVCVCVWYWGWNSGPSPWVTPPALFFFFCEGFFWDRVSWTIYQGWLWTVILLISASWVARFIGVSHWHPATRCFYKLSKTWIEGNTLNVYAHPHSYVLNSNLQSDCYRRWGLFRVRVKSSCIELVSLKKRPWRDHHPFLRVDKAVYEKEGPQQTWDVPMPWCWTSQTPELLEIHFSCL
jgi:hypothetical protein